jgi:hypothetical protein
MPISLVVVVVRSVSEQGEKKIFGIIRPHWGYVRLVHVSLLIHVKATSNWRQKIPRVGCQVTNTAFRQSSSANRSCDVFDQGRCCYEKTMNTPVAPDHSATISIARCGVRCSMDRGCRVVTVRPYCGTRSHSALSHFNLRRGVTATIAAPPFFLGTTRGGEDSPPVYKTGVLLLFFEGNWWTTIWQPFIDCCASTHHFTTQQSNFGRLLYDPSSFENAYHTGREAATNSSFAIPGRSTVVSSAQEW